jgi:hypothetical protein
MDSDGVNGSGDGPGRRTVLWPSGRQILRQLGVVGLVAALWGVSLVGVIRITYGGGDVAASSGRAERAARPGRAGRGEPAGSAAQPTPTNAVAVAGGEPSLGTAPDEPVNGRTDPAAGPADQPPPRRPAAAGSPAAAESLAEAAPEVNQPDRSLAGSTAGGPPRERPAAASPPVDDPFQVDEAEVGDLGGVPLQSPDPMGEVAAPALRDAEGAPNQSGPPTEDDLTTIAAGSAEVSFSGDVMPILDRRCVKCHGGERPEGGRRIEEGLSLLTWEDVLAGSTWGVVVVPGDPVGSFLLEQVETGEMPEKEPRLLPREVRAIRQWIEAGAPKN